MSTRTRDAAVIATPPTRTMTSLNCIVGERRTYSDRANTHDHPYAQLILPLQGSLQIETPQQQLELNSSCLFFLPPQCQHTFFASGSNEFLVLDIPSFWLDKLLDKRLQQGFSSSFDDRWQAIRLLILAELEHPFSDSSNLITLFQYAYQLLIRDDVPRSIQYIHAHYHQSLTTAELAQIEGYHLTYYCEWFKQITGKTPKAYIQHLRLQQAKEQLAATDQSILAIAQQVGYEHHASLTRLFQQLEGTTPAAYRQNSRKSVK